MQKNIDGNVHRAWNKRKELRAKGDKLYAEGNKLFAKGNKLRDEGYKLYFKGRKLWNEGRKLYAEGEKLYVEGDLVFLNAVIACYGAKARLYWKDADCTVNGQTYFFDNSVEPSSCNGKVVVIDGIKYRLTKVK